LLFLSASSCDSSSKLSYRARFPSSTISKKSTTLSLKDDYKIRSKTSMNKWNEGFALNGTSN
jgi:hypothetical protein